MKMCHPYSVTAALNIDKNGNRLSFPGKLKRNLHLYKALQVLPAHCGVVISLLQTTISHSDSRRLNPGGKGKEGRKGLKKKKEVKTLIQKMVSEITLCLLNLAATVFFKYFNEYIICIHGSALR